MITDLVLGLLYGIATQVIGLLPGNSPPAWLADGSGYLSQVWVAGAGLGAWMPWALVAQVTAGVLIAAGIGLGIKVGRIVASFLTLGGGAAG